MRDKPKNAGQTTADAAALRKQAEQQVRSIEPTVLSAQTPEEIEQLFHELQVHKIELEMQNEELRRVQEGLAIEKERYFDLYDLAPVGYGTFSEKGLILQVNLTATALLGAPRGALVKQPISHFIFKEDQDSYYLLRKKLFETGEPQDCELRLIKAEGMHFWAHLTATVAEDKHGSPVGRFVLEDITERKQAEQALGRAQKMEAIGQLTGGIAHDFNNILGIIIGNLDLLKHQVSDDRALNRVETTIKSAQRAAALTRQLLSFSRQQNTQLVCTDIRRVIRDMEGLIARSLTPEIAVELRFVEEPWLTEIDPGDFQDALLNLAINARDAMPGGGKLTLEVRNCTLDAAYCARNPGTTPGEYVQLAVSDNGVGIAPENREKIFEPFFTTKPRGKGTGLGLALVYGFTKRSGGTVQAYSEQAIGTTIRLYLPRAQGAEQPLESGARPTEHLPRGSETILVVDDEALLLELAREYLLPLGYRVLTASNGPQAMERLAAEPDIDLLFSDVVMPGGMNGYELAEQATNTRPQLKVLLTSGYTSKAAVHNGQARFAANLLSKPYSQIELAQGVRRLLGESGMSESDRCEPDLAPVQRSAVTIEWTDALSIGVDAIDADHKTLLALLNRSQQAMALKESEQHSHRILDELSDYVQTHFQREEAVMAAIDYPGFENHRQVHELLLKQIEKKRTQLKRGRLNIADLVEFLQSWLLDHIQNMDHAIAPYCEGRDDLIEQALQQGDIVQKSGTPS